MYKQKKIKKLGKKTSHREALIRNQLRSLFENGKVTTTSTKAKALKASAESLIENSKKVTDKLVSRRNLQVIFGSTELVAKFNEYIAKENTGVTIVKVGFRAGDNAETSRVELMGLKKAKKEKKEEKVEEKKEKKVEKKETVGIEKRTSKRNIASQKGTVVNKERAKSRSGL